MKCRYCREEYSEEELAELVDFDEDAILMSEACETCPDCFGEIELGFFPSEREQAEKSVETPADYYDLF